MLGKEVQASNIGIVTDGLIFPEGQAPLYNQPLLSRARSETACTKLSWAGQLTAAD